MGEHLVLGLEFKPQLLEKKKNVKEEKKEKELTEAGEMERNYKDILEV